MLTWQIPLIITSYPCLPSLLANPINGTQRLYWADYCNFLPIGLYYCLQENTSYNFVLPTRVVPRMSPTSYFDVLWDGR